MIQAILLSRLQTWLEFQQHLYCVFSEIFWNWRRKVLGWSYICSWNSKNAHVLRWHANFWKGFQDRIRKKIMNVVRVDESWIHFFELHWKISNSVWLTKDARRLSIAKSIASVKKFMYAIFFNTKGLPIQVPVPKGKSMNARFYKKKKKVLRKLVRFFQKRRPKMGIWGMYLLHDKASSHKAESVTSFLNDRGSMF